MTDRRHWSDFPTSLIELVQKFEEIPKEDPLILQAAPKNDAYSIRNEFHRFRRAIVHAIHDGEHDPILHELYGTVRDMSLSLAPVSGNPGLYQITYRRQAISRYLDKWVVPQPHVEAKEH